MTIYNRTNLPEEAVILGIESIDKDWQILEKKNGPVYIGKTKIYFITIKNYPEMKITVSGSEALVTLPEETEQYRNQKIGESSNKYFL